MCTAATILRLAPTLRRLSRARDPREGPTRWPRLYGTHVAGLEKSRSVLRLDKKEYGASVNSAAFLRTYRVAAHLRRNFESLGRVAYRPSRRHASDPKRRVTLLVCAVSALRTN
jgi:hypothetical protein